MAKNPKWVRKVDEETFDRVTKRADELNNSAAPGFFHYYPDVDVDENWEPEEDKEPRFTVEFSKLCERQVRALIEAVKPLEQEEDEEYWTRINGLQHHAK